MRYKVLVSLLNIINDCRVPSLIARFTLCVNNNIKIAKYCHLVNSTNLFMKKYIKIDGIAGS